MLQKSVLVLAALFLWAVVSASPAKAYPTTELKVVVSALGVEGGDDFDVMVEISSATPVRGVQLILDFNPEVVEFVGYTPGDFLENWAEANDREVMVISGPTTEEGHEKGPYTAAITGSAGGGPVESGTVVTYHFRVLEDYSSSTTDLTLDEVAIADADGNTIRGAQSVNGRLRIGGSDEDDDGVSDSVDNCPGLPNTDQLNSDSGRRGVPEGTPTPIAPDRTNAHGDSLGDACDMDDDNDGISDVFEATGGTDPTRPDTDGDRWIDGEDPNPSDWDSSLPCAGQPTPDADSDSLIDCREERAFLTNPLMVDSDSDDCQDYIEVKSLNGDYAIGQLDVDELGKSWGCCASTSDGCTQYGVECWDPNKDLNADRKVSMPDVVEIARDWEESCSCSNDGCLEP